MAIGSDWDIDFNNLLISHIDGDLDYDTGGGTLPDIGGVIRGATTGALGKILSISGSAATGTLTLTDVEGQFQDGESIVWQDQVDFDTVTNGGFAVGETVDGASRTGTIRKIDYNDGGVAGTGTIYGEFGAGTWTPGEDMDVAASVKALADGAGSDNSLVWTGVLVNEGSNGTITEPTLSTIVNYDTGTEDFVRFSKIQNLNTSPTKTAFIQQAYGVTATGSLRLVDVSGDWDDADLIFVGDKLPYDTVVFAFKIGDVVLGASSGTTGKILADNGTILTLQNQTGSGFTNSELIEVGGTTFATVDADAGEGDFNTQHAVQNLEEIAEQLAVDGGVYNGTSINGIRDANALYTHLQDTFDELGALYDTISMTAQVILQQYTLVNGWKIPDLSFRFIESGSIQDSGLDNIWTNYQTIGTVAGITDLVYAEVTPQPRIYFEQGGSVLAPFWLPGHIDVLVKVKSNSLPTIAADGVGLLVSNGTVTVFAREFGSTYDHFQTTTVAGVAPVPLATSSDLNNTTGTHAFDFDAPSGTFTVGEEFRVAADITKRGIVRTQTASRLEYVLTGATQFQNNDVVVGERSVANGTVDETVAIETLVAGYGTDIVIATIDISLACNTFVGDFDEGERVDQAVSSAAGILMKTDGSSLIHIGNITGTFDATNIVTGVNSGATATATGSPSTITTLTKDILDGNGAQPYNAVIYLDRTDADPQPLVKMYEWTKYRTRSLEAAGEPVYNLLGGPGAASGEAGQIYITLISTYALVKAAPFGTFAGGTFFGATGVFIQDMDATEIRNFQLVDSNEVLRFPPNQQALTVQGLVADDRVVVFRRVDGTPGSAILFAEYTLDTEAGDFNGSGDVIIKVDSAVGTDTPTTGVVRVRNATSLLFESFAYSSLDTTLGEFTVAALGSNLTAGEDVYVPLIEATAGGASETATIIYDADIPLLARVRKKGILPFEVEGLFLITGATLTAIRTTDTIVD